MRGKHFTDSLSHRELWIFGILALITTLLFLRTMYNPPQRIIIMPEPPTIPQEILYEEPVYELPAELPAYEQPAQTVPAGPTRAKLTPDHIEFSVNRILVPPAGAYPFLPIRIDRTRVFSGKFGPYAQDPTAFVDVQLCSYAYKYENQVLACDRPRLSYQDGFVVWGLGYAEDEFIGGQAIRDFGAAFIIKSKDHGVLAQSNQAIINLVD